MSEVAVEVGKKEKGSGKKVKSISGIRHCRICGGELCSYNPNDVCFRHILPELDRAPVTRCTSPSEEGIMISEINYSGSFDN